MYIDQAIIPGSVKLLELGFFSWLNAEISIIPTAHEDPDKIFATLYAGVKSSYFEEITIIPSELNSTQTQLNCQ